MGRLIDADRLKSTLAREARDWCNRNGPMCTIDFESLIDRAPTVDAIPVEWLEQQTREGYYKMYASCILALWQVTGKK